MRGAEGAGERVVAGLAGQRETGAQRTGVSTYRHQDCSCSQYRQEEDLRRFEAKGTVMSVSEEEMYENVARTFPSLDEWSATLGEPFMPEPGSDLDEDDEDWPPHRASQVAAHGLIGARDHLQAVRRLLEARELFPLAQSSLTRAALVGASQTVWMLAPADRPTRLRRARTLAHDNYRHHLSYINTALTLPAELLLSSASDAAVHIDLRREQLAAKRTDDGQADRPNVTDIVEWAANDIYGEGSVLATQTVLVWRSTSGAAHGYLWGLLGQPGTVIRPDDAEEEMAFYDVAGNMIAVGFNYLSAYHMARKGMELLMLRSTHVADDPGIDSGGALR